MGFPFAPFSRIFSKNAVNHYLDSVFVDATQYEFARQKRNECINT